MPLSSFARGEIIEEEERLGALDDQIVGAHRDEVDADAVVAAAVDGELELGADAVIGGDQQGIAIAGRLEVEEAAEAAERGVRARPRGRLGERRDRLDQRVAGGDVDARFGVGVAFVSRSPARPSHNPLGFPRPTRQKARVTRFRLPARRDSCRLPCSLLVGGGVLYAQLEGADRGIPPIDSTSNFEILGVEVDVAAESAEKARIEGWRRAQLQGWKMLWARTHNRPVVAGADLPESVLDGIVSGIVIEQEQIGPTRYIARLGVLFDRARTGQLLGVQGLVRRSAPMLVIPVMRDRLDRLQLRISQRMAARLGAVPHRRQPDRLCPADRLGHRSAAAQPRPDPAPRPRLVADAARPIWRGRHRRSRGRAAARSIPGGPAVGIFTARYGPGQPVSRPLHPARRATAPRSRACSTRACAGSTCSTPGARPRPAPARSEPRHHRAAAAAAARGGRWRIRCSRTEPPPGSGRRRRGQLQPPGRRRPTPARSSRPKCRSAGSTESPRRSPPASRSAAPRSCGSASSATPPRSRPRSRRRAGGSRW